MKKCKSITYLQIVVLLLFLFAPSCSSRKVKVTEPTPDPALVDTSWLTGEPCVAPCWYGLEPGKTKKKEAFRVTRELSFISLATVDTGTIWGNADTLAFRCKDPSNAICVYMVFEEDTLSLISIFLHNDVTLAELVESNGDPDGFTIRPINAEGKGCTISLFWIDRRMQVGYSDDWQKQSIFRDDLCQTVSKAGLKIPSKLLVPGIQIVDDKLMKLHIGNSLIPWNGFIPDK